MLTFNIRVNIQTLSFTNDPIELKNSNTTNTTNFSPINIPNDYEAISAKTSEGLKISVFVRIHFQIQPILENIVYIYKNYTEVLYQLYSDHYLIREVKDDKRAFKFKYEIFKKWWITP